MNPYRTRIARSFLVVTCALALMASASGSGPASAAPAAVAPVNMRSLARFAVLASSTVTNTGPTVLNGNLGLSPGTSVTGFPPGAVRFGAIHAADTAAALAQSDLALAYDDAAGRTGAIVLTGDLGGRTLLPGVYSGGALGITGTLTLDGRGDPNAVFIFKAASTLITASSSNVRIVGRAQACNVFWQVGSSATLGTGSHMTGTVMALASITATTGVTGVGRLLARTAAVTLDTNAVTRPTCVPPR